MYETDEDIEQDYSKAFEEYSWSAFHLNPDAQWKVTLWCDSGVGYNRAFIETSNTFVGQQILDTEMRKSSH